MKVFTVIHVDADDGCFPFVFSYSSRQAAAQAIEDAAKESFEANVDPNDGDEHVFPGLAWDTAVSKAVAEDDSEYWITETELK